ncbi:MAG: putative toxin-antitoxin system toxin component, PIN family [Nitrospirae bacterium]|nr:putative toxin-antitoxin system toxin component, PIN family [Nitrospirota bacterium]
MFDVSLQSAGNQGHHRFNISKAERITLKGNLNICRDPDDDVIIETAVRGRAKYLVTGDKDIADDKTVSSYLSQHGVTVISLQNFLSLIGKD